MPDNLGRVRLNVEGMSCQHCVMAVKKAVSALPGVGEVAVDLGAKTVSVAFDSSRVSIEAISHAIESAGYDVVGTVKQ